MAGNHLMESRRDLEQLFDRFFGTQSAAPWPSAGYEVPTDVFHADGKLHIRMDVPDADPDAIDVSVQENVLLVNGRRDFPYDAEDVRFVRRGTFYGDFTQRIALGKGLDVEKISARYERGVLELVIPHAAEAQPKKISVEVGDKALSS